MIGAICRSQSPLDTLTLLTNLIIFSSVMKLSSLQRIDVTMSGAVACCILYLVTLDFDCCGVACLDD